MNGKIIFEDMETLVEFLKLFEGSTCVFEVKATTYGQWVLQFTGGLQMYTFEMKHEVTVKVTVTSQDGISWKLNEEGRRQFQDQIRVQIREMYKKGAKK